MGDRIDAKNDGEQENANHKQRPVVYAADRHLAEFLRYDAGHRMGRLEKCSNAGGKIRNFDAISRD